MGMEILEFPNMVEGTIQIKPTTLVVSICQGEIPWESTLMFNTTLPIGALGPYLGSLFGNTKSSQSNKVHK